MWGRFVTRHAQMLLNSGRLLKLPTKAGKPRWLYCHPAGPGRRNLTVRLSLDEGRTWTGGSLLLRKGDSQYSSMALLRNGLVGVLYDCWENNNYQLYFTTFAPAQLTQSTISNHTAIYSFQFAGR